MCVYLLRKLLRLSILKLLWTFAGAIFLYIVVRSWIHQQDSSVKDEVSIYHLKEKKDVVPKSENPPVVWWNLGYRLRDETIECSNNLKCDAFGGHRKIRQNSDGAYLFYASRIDFKNLPLPRHPEKIIWALSHEESPKNVPELLHNPGLNLFNISSTFSRYSDVPFPLQYMGSLENITSGKYYVPTRKKNDLLKEISPVIFLSSSCYTFSDRDNYVKELMKYIPIDSYGKCLNNKKWPKGFPKDYLNNMYDDTFLSFVASYKFAIAIENGVCEDYITEKFWRPIALGVVPIYFGSPSIRDWFPNNNSAILIQDFPSPKLLSEYLYKLLSNDYLYEEYLQHKSKGFVSNRRLLEEMEDRSYQTDISKTALAFECFVCAKLHENRKKPSVKIVTKSHYDCSKPISALTREPIASEIPFWESSKHNAEEVYKRVQSSQ